MSEQIKNGGPAFPVFGVNCVRVEMDGSAEWEPQQISDGMSLRDYMAAKAMPAVYRDFWDDVRAGRNDCVPEGWKMGIALDAYAMADAMLAAREGGKEENQPSPAEISSDIKQANLNRLAEKVQALLFTRGGKIGEMVEVKLRELNELVALAKELKQ